MAQASGEVRGQVLDFGSRPDRMEIGAGNISSQDLTDNFPSNSRTAYVRHQLVDHGFDGFSVPAPAHLARSWCAPGRIVRVTCVIVATTAAPRWPKKFSYWPKVTGSRPYGDTPVPASCQRVRHSRTTTPGLNIQLFMSFNPAEKDYCMQRWLRRIQTSAGKIIE